MAYLYRSILPFLALLVLQGCRVGSTFSALPPDLYQIRHATQPDLLTQKIYVVDGGDSLQLVLPATDERRQVTRSTYQSWTFQRSEIDVDVFTLPFKIRPSQGNLPPQLNSNFNAAVYLGRRIDLYKYHWEQVTPTFAVRKLRSRGLGYGLFAGIGSVAINDYVTRQPVGVEYEGVVLNAGIATIYDARIFNVGVAVGVDQLTDRNSRGWIYQQKPWFGVLFGLNLN